jgi:membrane-associated protease RseP (regulator of RpoE activity)
VPQERSAETGKGGIEIRVAAGGKPLAGAAVKLYLRGRTDPNTEEIEWRLTATAQTGPDGLAHLPGGPGTWFVAARAPGLSTARHEFQRPSGEPVTRVALELKPGVTVEGHTLQKGSREPVPLALLTLSQLRNAPEPILVFTGRSQDLDVPADETEHASSDGAGSFRFQGVAPGVYLLQARATGFATASSHIEAPAHGVELQLVPAGFIEGVVRTATGAPAAGAEVFAVGEEEAATATTSATGTFSLQVAPRSWNVAARRGDEAGRREQPVVVTAGGTVRGVDIVLGAAASIAGTVVAAGSKSPVSGAQIDVSPRGFNGDAGRAVSGIGGAYAVGGLPPGVYDVVVSAPGYTTVERMGISVAAAQRYPLSLELRATGALEGAVRDASGRPVAWALVRPAHGDSMAPEARSDAAGAYHLAGVAAGRGMFSAQPDGSTLGVWAAADVPTGGTGHLDFTLPGEGVLTGKLRRRDGSLPPPDALVHATRLGPGPPGPSTSLPLDASGAFVASLPAGSYVLMAGMAGQRDRVPATVEAGATTTQDVVFVEREAHEGEVGLSGVVLEPDGTPSPHARVMGTAANGENTPVFFETTDEAGHFAVKRPRADLPDSFDVTGQQGGRRGRVRIEPGQAEVTVRMEAAATLRGRILGSPPPETFRLRLTSRRSGRAFGTENGMLEFTGDRFELPGLPPEDAHLDVRTADGRSGQADVQLAAGRVESVEISLQDGAAVVGRIVDRDRPLPNVVIRVDRDSVQSGDDGRFRLPVIPGSRNLEVRSADYQPLQRPFTVEAGQTLDLGDVALARLGFEPGTIGMQLRSDSDTQPTVTLVYPGSPADQAGVRVGDIVLAVDGARVSSMSDAIAKIRGQPGTMVQLLLRRGSAETTISIKRSG